MALKWRSPAKWRMGAAWMASPWRNGTPWRSQNPWRNWLTWQGLYSPRILAAIRRPGVIKLDTQAPFISVKS